ncbi:MAG TPA: hypothetical protein VES20_20880 [Bryobacteraceae bacterium]|nr:hypothetical protein [Bryobacteraceae bacterium]
MRRRLWLIDLTLLAMVVWSARALDDRWNASSAREQALLRQMIPPGPPPVVPSLPVVAPSTPAAYMEVAQQFLFSRDRNPNVILDPPPPPPPPKPMPPLPLAYGLMDLGGGPTVIMSERSGAQHRGYRPGERIGDFKLVAIQGSELTFEWDGKLIKRKVEEIIDRRAAESTAAPPEQAAATAAAKPPTTLAPLKAGPGVELGENSRACVPGDTNPPGTVQDGFRKVVNKTPFGDSCRWEKAQ